MSKNLATTTVAVAPSPATSGTTLTVATGTGSRLYDGLAVLHPTGAVPTADNAEVVAITVAGDIATLTRAQESSTARAVVVGDVLTQGVTAAMWDGLVSSNASKANAAHVHSAADVASGTLPLARGGTGGTDAATARASLGLGSAATMTPATIAADPAVSGTYAPGGTAGNAPLASPVFTGTPSVPTATAGTATTQAASTQFVAEAVTSVTSGMVDVKRAYDLKGDTKQLYSVATTAGSAVITDANASFVAGDVGKVVRVESTTPVITTILSRQSATQVTLAANIATTHVGLTAYYGTDDTAGIQQAFTDYGNAAIAGTGSANLFFPAGCYMVAGALSGDTWNAQLKVPYQSMQNVVGNKPWSFRIFGEGRAEGYYLNGSPSMPMTGTIFYSPIQGSGTLPAVIRTAPTGLLYPNANFVAFEVDGVTFRTGAKSGLIALGLFEANTCRIGVARGITVDVGIPTNVNNPTGNASVGILFPGNNNGAAVQVGGLYVSGYGTGVKASEHLDVKSLTIQNCWIACQFAQMNHAASIDRMLIQWCVYGFGALGNCYVNINQLDIENGETAPWLTIQHFDDPTHRMMFDIKQMHVVHAGTPWVRMNGGRNIRIFAPTVDGANGELHDRLPIRTANYSMDNNELLAIANGAAITVTLPSAVTAIKGRTPYVVKNINAASCTVASGGGTIDGAATATLIQWAKGTYISDGTNWLSV